MTLMATAEQFNKQLGQKDREIIKLQHELRKQKDNNNKNKKKLENKYKKEKELKTNAENTINKINKEFKQYKDDMSKQYENLQNELYQKNDECKALENQIVNSQMNAQKKENIVKEPNKNELKKNDDQSIELIKKYEERIKTKNYEYKKLENKLKESENKLKESEKEKNDISLELKTYLESVSKSVSGSYSFDNIIAYKSKNIKDIQPTQSIQQQQNEIDQQIKIHKQRLNKWKQYENNLNEQYNKIALEKNENDNKENDDEKKNENDQEIEFYSDSDENQKKSHQNIEIILDSYTNCKKLLDEQQSRSEDTGEYIVELNTLKNDLKKYIKKYNKDIKDKKKVCGDLLSKYNETKELREKLQIEAEKYFTKANEQICNENELNKEKCDRLNEQNLLITENKKYELLLTDTNSLKTSYAEFEEYLDKKSDELNIFFKEKFINHERVWFEWNVNDIMCWIKYLIFNNKIILSDDITKNLDKIEEAMISQNINGIKFKIMDKVDIKLLGFEQFNDRNEMYKKIRWIVDTYRIPITNQNENENENNEIEGLQLENTQKILIPKEYQCPISKEIMRDPVIIYDNKTYERKNILEYLKQNGKAPGIDEEWDEHDDVFIRNKRLKQNIESFLSVNPQFATKH